MRTKHKNKAWARSWTVGLQGTNPAGSQSGTWIRSLPIRGPALYLLGPRRPLKVTFDATVMHSRKNVLAWKDNSQASKAHVYSFLFLYCLLVAIDLWCIVKWEFLFSFFLVIAPSFPPPEPPSCPGDVTRDDSHRRVLAQQSVATLLRHCFE